MGQDDFCSPMPQPIGCEMPVNKAKRKCEGCGKEVGQTDITQRDADGNTWHCKCADEALAKLKDMQAVVEVVRHEFTECPYKDACNAGFKNGCNLNAICKALAALDKGEKHDSD